MLDRNPLSTYPMFSCCNTFGLTPHPLLTFLLGRGRSNISELRSEHPGLAAVTSSSISYSIFLSLSLSPHFSNPCSPAPNSPLPSQPFNSSHQSSCRIQTYGSAPLQCGTLMKQAPPWGCG